MKYYKVLYKDTKGKLFSVGRAFGHPDELVLKYTPGKTTTALEGTKLFIFDSYDNAQRFVKAIFPTHLDWTEIWEVEAQPIRSIRGILSIDFYAIASIRRLRERLLAYWQCILRDNGRTLLNTIKAPAGTLVCAAVILKRKVEVDNVH